MMNSMPNKEAKTPLTKKERLNLNLVIALGMLGGILGVVLAVVEKDGDAALLMSHSPLPAGIALGIAFVWVVIVPVVAWFWHTRAIDEQEASAYRDGGYYSAYAYLILAPTWWLLWRGGLMPQPDGVAIYFAFAMIWTAVWFWKKYR
jgi:hypothetical protein